MTDDAPEPLIVLDPMRLAVLTPIFRRHLRAAAGYLPDAEIEEIVTLQMRVLETGELNPDSDLVNRETAAIVAAWQASTREVNFVFPNKGSEPKPLAGDGRPN